ncbi:MAG: alpha-glucosidase, family 31 of glycosyl hydrolase [Firmicutes bacterium]|nr:alpha-glucosidase, family 31 of glycosyl hydrolase [Bacillota bacterium]
MFIQKNNKLIYRFDNETVVIEGWGANSLRLRATRHLSLKDELWALLPTEDCQKINIKMSEEDATITNGKIHAMISKNGKIVFYNQKNQVLLEEYVRDRSNVEDIYSSLKITAREFKRLEGGDFKLVMRFESDSKEKIFGMGQYQQPFFNLKGCKLELAQRNSQVSVPFLLSNKGYGFLWNNPAVGKVTFGNNITEWESDVTKQIDYWITAGDTPKEIEEAYASVTGTVPMIPEHVLGLWQCKLRYQTQAELLEVAREYKRRKLPIDVMIADFFHWPHEGDWCFDPEYWPDPKAMVDELKEMGIKLMVSIWPTVEPDSTNYKKMKENGYLLHTFRGVPATRNENTIFYDSTNPDAREFMWDVVKKNYYEMGVEIFWLDEAEPAFSSYDFDHYYCTAGPMAEVGNIYPFMYAQTFYEGMAKEGQKNIINLIRCAWAGSQRYGALVWSGDIPSTFDSLKIQIRAGLNMAIAGIPWWTTDIGGFFGANAKDPRFHECLIRWFQYAVFSPILRMHGDRSPHTEPIGTTGGGKVNSGHGNELWSYGDRVYEILKKYLLLRERLKPYIKEIMAETHEKGTPVMRPLFYEFPYDAKAWGDLDEYMFGGDMLIAPVADEGVTQRKVYLPQGVKWLHSVTGETFDGGQTIDVEAPLDVIPVFLKNGKHEAYFKTFSD